MQGTNTQQEMGNSGSACGVDTIEDAEATANNGFGDSGAVWENDISTPMESGGVKGWIDI